MKSTIKKPKIGDEIYVPSSYYVYRGEDDFEGGLAIINNIEFSKHLPEEHFNYIMIGIEGRTTMYNYKSLLEKQAQLKKEFKNSVAHSNPDLRPEFNQPDGDWKVYK